MNYKKQLHPIFYASQTGNCKHLAIEASKYIILDNYNIYPISTSSILISQFISTNPLLLIISTHGDGDFNYNFIKIWLFLSYPHKKKIFNNIYFSILGCGNSLYKKYNFAAKKVYNRIIQLGGIPISKYLADEQDEIGIYTQYNLWLNDLINKLKKIPFNQIIIKPKIKNIIKAKIINKIIYNNNEFQDIMNLKLKILNINYYPGMVCSFIPLNINIKEFIKYNKLKEEKDLELLNYNTIPNFILLKELYLHIKEKNSFHFKDIKRKEIILEKLKELSLNYELYYSFIKMENKTLFELLKEFKIFLSYEFLIKNCNKNDKRYFTLPIINNNTYELTITLLNKIYFNKKVNSLTSEFLRSLLINNFLEIEIFNSFLYFNKNKILVLCTGSGISVARSIWNYFKGNKEILVYYGYRFEKDKLFIKECSLIKKLKIIGCPSREGNRMYIQDVFKKEFNDSIDDYDIVIGGNSILIKEFRKTFNEKYNKEIYFMTETW